MTIAENLERIIDAKEAIKDAIVSKGGQVSEDAKIDEYADAIEALPSGEEIERKNFIHFYSDDSEFGINFGSGKYSNLDYSYDNITWLHYSKSHINSNVEISSLNRNLYVRFEYYLPTYQTIGRNLYVSYGTNVKINECILTSNTYSEYYSFFAKASNIKEINILQISIFNQTSAGFSYLFSGNTSLVKINKLILKSSAGQSFRYMFQDASNLIIEDIDISGIKSYGDSETFQYMFQNCKKLNIQFDFLSVSKTGSSEFQYMFAGCTSLTKTGNIGLYGNIANNTSNMFNGCTSLKEMTWTATTPPTINANIWSGCPSDMIIYVPIASLEDYKAASVWSSRAAYILPIEQPKNIILTSYNPVTIKSYTNKFNVECVFEIEIEDGTKFNLNKTYNLTTDENLGDESVSKNFDIEFLGFNFTITITQTANDPKTITNVENYGTYGFNLNDNGYYESNNKGKSSSFAYATVTFVPQSDSVTFECINSGESNYDYGIISQLNQELAKSASGDTSTTLVKKSFKGLSSLNPVDVVYNGLTVGETYTITVKFIKDSSGDQGNDSFQFKVKGE